MSVFGGDFLSGFRGLFHKEILRFWRVAVQTLLAPAATSFLYLLVFSHILENRVRVFAGVSYIDFLVVGLTMMSILQNSFANSASSLVQSRVTGNLVFVLLPPISPFAFFAAYALASVMRGLCVGAAVLAVGLFFADDLTPAAPWAVLYFAAMGALLAGALGIVAGLWAEKFDQMALFQNFVIMPLTFLSGVFYSLASLPPLWRAISQGNPFFLHDRRFSARLFRPIRRGLGGGFFVHDRGRFGGLRLGVAAGRNRLQNPLVEQ